MEGLGYCRALVPSAFFRRDFFAFLFPVENRGLDKVLGALQANPFRGGITGSHAAVFSLQQT